jgi:hypothetical protein
MKTTDFIVENEFIGDDAHAMHKDHEVQMAREECYHAAKDAIELHKLLKRVSELDGLDGWVSEKISIAADYLKTVREYLEYDQLSQEAEGMPEFAMESAQQQLTAVLEEGVAEGSLKEDATGGATGAASIGAVVGELGGKPPTGKPKKISNVIRRPQVVQVGKGVY